MILSKQLAVRVLRRAFKWHVAKIKDIAVSENWVHRQTCYLNREDDVNCKDKAYWIFEDNQSGLGLQGKWSPPGNPRQNHRATYPAGCNCN